MTKRSQYRWVVAGSCVVAFGSCAPHRQAASGAPVASGERVRVVAVERVYGDLALQLGGDAVDVTTILNSPSADPHAYEPTPRDADAVAAADLIVQNGLGYDSFADKLVAASPRAGRTLLDVGKLAGFHIGDNPHVWYDAQTLRRFTNLFAVEIVRRMPAQRAAISRRRAVVLTWIAGFSGRLRALGLHRAGTRVAITEPVFDYVLHAARLQIATPASFSHAIEEGNDPAPQDVDTMRALLAGRGVAAFVYNRQTVEPSTARLLDIATKAGVPIVPVTETLPANVGTQQWIDGEVAALERAL